MCCTHTHTHTQTYKHVNTHKHTNSQTCTQTHTRAPANKTQEKLLIITKVSKAILQPLTLSNGMADVGTP